MGDILSSQYLINPECIGASLTKDVINLWLVAVFVIPSVSWNLNLKPPITNPNIQNHKTLPPLKVLMNIVYIVSRLQEKSEFEFSIYM
jgi:hypothetical protein